MKQERWNDNDDDRDLLSHRVVSGFNWGCLWVFMLNLLFDAALIYLLIHEVT